MYRPWPAIYDGVGNHHKEAQTMTNNKTLSYVQIAAGTAIAAAAIDLFLVPLELPLGGMSGVFMLVHYLWKIPIGSMYFLFNLPLLAWLFRLKGKGSVARTLWGMGTFSLFLELMEPMTRLTPTDNALLSGILGGGLVGLGLGLAFRVGGSTGGSSALAQVVEHYTGISVPKFLLVTDIVTLLVSGVLLRVEALMYGVVITFVLMFTIAKVQEGFTVARCLMIITQDPDKVAGAILTRVGRGVTRLEGLGEYSGRPRPVLMCVVGETEVPRVKRLILEADPEAFVVITAAEEVAGPGFTLDTPRRRVPFWATQRGA